MSGTDYRESVPDTFASPEVNANGLDLANVLLQRRVTGNLLDPAAGLFSRAGGGTEILYNGPIPLEYVTRIE